MNVHKYTNVPVFAGLGNPLLDVSVILKDKSLLDKYNLEPDGQKEVNSKDFTDILTTLKREGYSLTYNPGGCAQNTFRIIQKLVCHNNFGLIFGGVGADESGDILESQIIKSGILTKYAKHKCHLTGMAISLINGDLRSLVAHLGAAQVYRIEDFKTAENLTLMNNVHLVYIEGFFITHSCDVAIEMIRVCRNLGITLVFNVCGAYVADVCRNDLVTVSSAADIVIGNQEEINSLAKAVNLELTSSDEFIVKLHSVLWEKADVGKLKLNQTSCFGKTIVMTCGKDPVLCVAGDGRLVKYVVPYVDPQHVKDPTGAGDAFAAGFLVAFLHEKSVLDCLVDGCAVAQQVIKHIGVYL